MKNADFNKFWKRNRSDLVRLLKSLKPHIGDDYRATEDPDDTIPAMQITISINDDCDSWTYQTGDNSYTGSCYHHPYWGVGTLYRRSNSPRLANELIRDLAEQIEFEN
jgi:hypothetical protein